MPRPKMDLRATLVMVLPVIAIAYLGALAAHPPWTALRLFGAAAALAGLALLTLARLQLGSSFSLTPQARALVTHGLYARIRNPVYVFSSVTIAGLALYLQLPWLLALLALVIPVQVLRARAEARVLEATFGDEYRTWRARTWF